MNWKNIYKFAVNNYFISIFIAVIIFVGFVSVFKLTFSKTTYIYARVKVSQGQWWASTGKPSIAFVKTIKKGDVEEDLLGKPIAEVVAVRYYPGYSTYQNGYPFNQGFDIYLTLKLRVDSSKKTARYNFKRSVLAVGSPVDFEIGRTEFSTNVLDLSGSPYNDKYQEKVITLTKDSPSAWEYDGVKVGDKHFDGEDAVFEVLDKKLDKGLTVKAKIKVKSIANVLIYGEEQPVVLGKSLNLATDNFVFNEYAISGIE